MLSDHDSETLAMTATPSLCPASAAPEAGSPAAPAAQAAETAETGRAKATASSLRSLAIDVGVPLGSYYLMRDALGLSLWLSLALSSIVPVIRSVFAIVAERRLNLLAMLMLAVNIAGIAVSFWTGDPRMMIAKDSVISSVIALAILGSVALRRPLMSEGLRVFVTRGSADRTAAWNRLAASSPKFRRLELAFSSIWGGALLADCIARLVGAFTLPVTTMVWMGTVMLLGAIGLAIMLGGLAVGPMEKLIEGEIR
ncbi:MAG TPA: VC0807 family protein [Streptosporangiaceae bacterium]|nr:VC0807 family protein [Streptosporangiaceae bacterium]